MQCGKQRARGSFFCFILFLLFSLLAFCTSVVKARACAPARDRTGTYTHFTEGAEKEEEAAAVCYNITKDCLSRVPFIVDFRIE